MWAGHWGGGRPHGPPLPPEARGTRVRPCVPRELQDVLALPLGEPLGGDVHPQQADRLGRASLTSQYWSNWSRGRLPDLGWYCLLKHYFPLNTISP